MIGLPKSTEYNRRIPKQKFYENLTVTPALKRFIIDQVKVIYWRNKIAPSTINLAAGNTVTEIEIFEITLNEPKLDESVLRQMDKEIPYHIVFLLKYDGKCQAWTAYKEKSGNGNDTFRVGDYYHTEWTPESDLTLRLNGLNMDVIYENFVRQIAGDALSNAASGNPESLKDSVERDKQIRLLKKQIEALKIKVRKEKQLNRQMELNAELKKLKKEVEGL